MQSLTLKSSSKADTHLIQVDDALLRGDTDGVQPVIGGHL